MQSYDLLIICVIGACAVYGAYQGMLLQLSTVVSVILSSLVARQFAPFFAPFFEIEEPYNLWIATGILFMVSAFIVARLFTSLKTYVEKANLKKIDHFLGGCLGVIKGSLLALVITIGILILWDSMREKISESISVGITIEVIQSARPFFPEGWNATLDGYFPQGE